MKKSINYKKALDSIEEQFNAHNKHKTVELSTLIQNRIEIEYLFSLLERNKITVNAFKEECEMNLFNIDEYLN